MCDTPNYLRCIDFEIKKIKCRHRITANDVPPGLEPDDVALDCEEDPLCPENLRKNK